MIVRDLQSLGTAYFCTWNYNNGVFMSMVVWIATDKQTKITEPCHCYFISINITATCFPKMHLKYYRHT
jgi:hypothetical protein